MAIFNSYVSHYQRVYSNHKPAATRKMLEIHLLLVERPVALWTAHEPPYSFAPQISSFSTWKVLPFGRTSTEKSQVYRQYTLMIMFWLWIFPARVRSLEYLEDIHNDGMHSLYLLGIHPDSMPCHGSYVVDSSCRFFGILGYDSPETSSAKKNTFSPSTSTRYFRSCSDV